MTTKEAGMLGASDPEHLAWAGREDRVTFTQDADFLRLHAAGFAHKGIVYAHRQTPVGELVRGLMLVYELLDPNDMKDHVEFL
jgi:hypothetical protein